MKSKMELRLNLSIQLSVLRPLNMKHLPILLTQLEMEFHQPNLLCKKSQLTHMFAQQQRLTQ
jgi:hypothetical protein